MNEWDIVNGIDYQNGTIIAAAIIRPRSPINNTLSPLPLFSNHDIYNSLPFPDGYIFPPVFRSITYFKYTRIDCNYCSNPKSVYPADFYPSSTHEADIAHPPLSSLLVKGVAREEVLEIFKVVATRVKASFRTCARSIRRRLRQPRRLGFPGQLSLSVPVLAMRQVTSPAQEGGMGFRGRGGIASDGCAVVEGGEGKAAIVAIARARHRGFELTRESRKSKGG